MNDAIVPNDRNGKKKGRLGGSGRRRRHNRSCRVQQFLKNYLFEESGWQNKDDLVKILGTVNGRRTKEKKLTKPSTPVSKEECCILFLLSEGETKNVAGARVVPELK